MFIVKHMKMKNVGFLILALLLTTTPVSAQKKNKPRIIENAHGIATYVAEGNEGILDVKKKALKKAQLNAIEQAFGTALNSITGSTSTVDGKNTSSSFHENTNAEVRGEWLEDSKAPVYKLVSDDPLTYRVEVWGTIQEITAAKIDLNYRIYDYQDRETLEFQQTAIRESSHVYLDFHSPVNGNLVVYLLDETENKANLMLPYTNDHRPAYPVESGELLTFFKNRFQGKSTKMRLSTSKKVDYFQLYIIFSPNTINSSFDVKGTNSRQLNSMSIDKFHSWLAKTRNMDRSMVVNQETITLYNKTSR